MTDPLGLYPEEDIVTFLRKKGYRVVKEEYPEAKGVDTIPKLVDFFYSRRKFYQRGDFPASVDGVQSRKYVSSFVKSREKLGVPRKVAVKEAAVIIDALFRYEDQLRLKEPISGTSILTSRSIMDRICALLGSEYCELQDQEVIQEWNEYYNEQDSQKDFESATKELERILERLHDNNKERRRRVTERC